MNEPIPEQNDEQLCRERDEALYFEQLEADQFEAWWRAVDGDLSYITEVERD